MLLGYYQKKKKKAFKKDLFVKNTKIFPKKKKDKKRQYTCERYINLSKDEKEKKSLKGVVKDIKILQKLDELTRVT